MRIGSISYFIWVSYEKPGSSYCVMQYSGEAAGEIEMPETDAYEVRPQDWIRFALDIQSSSREFRLR